MIKMTPPQKKKKKKKQTMQMKMDGKIGQRSKMCTENINLQFKNNFHCVW